jgi:hypothetical protein
MNLFFTPFQNVEARKVWSAESPIELFLIQELARRGLFPQVQMLIMGDGSTFPSLYDLWKDIEFRHMPGLLTEADLFFPHQRVAVFCDSTRHHRGRKAREKDAAISERLRALSIASVRVPGGTIVRDLKAAADLVGSALSDAR